MAEKPYIIALEEHYYDPEVKRHASGFDAVAVPHVVERLDDLGPLRLAEMAFRCRVLGEFRDRRDASNLLIQCRFGFEVRLRSRISVMQRTSKPRH